MELAGDFRVLRRLFFSASNGLGAYLQPLMKNPPKSAFQIYRYQILPLSREFTPDLFAPEIKSVEELLGRKNDFFMTALLGISKLESKRTNLVHKFEGTEDNAVAIKIAANRSISLETRDFHVHETETWPSIMIYVDNNPDQQLIAVQRRNSAFQQTSAPVHSLIKAVNTKLQHHHLRAFFEPLFEKHVFWSLLNRNEGKLKEVAFELVTPNMSNISSSLSEELKALAKGSNAIRTKVQLEADKDTVLEIKPSDPNIQGLVEYAAQGGGDIKIKASGMRRSIHTSKSVKEVVIDQVEIEGQSPRSVIDTLKRLLSL